MSPCFFVFQPDDMPFYDDWGPPANSPSNGTKKVEHPGLPNRARVRSAGVTFSAGYVVSPACGTSRFSAMTGRYPSRSLYGHDKP